MANPKRKFKNMIVNPKFQIKIGLYFVVSNLLIFGILFVLIANFYTQLNLLLFEANTSIKVLQGISSAYGSFILLSLGVLGGYFLIIMFYSVIVSHRISGPEKAICAYIDEMAEGNLSPKRNLRPYDDLVNIMERLKVLSENLEKKYGAK